MSIALILFLFVHLYFSKHLNETNTLETPNQPHGLHSYHLITPELPPETPDHISM